ncbi:MAG TPA: rod shape-determining protein MreC [Holophagaceae bacterium]|nr:rod shape-determining protein MreC [Holophagaceae bacterium]
MARRASPWGWSPAGRRRWALILLWLGHGVWVLSGPDAGGAWRNAASTAERPVEALAAAWRGWRLRRAERATDLAAAQTELAALRQQVQALETAQLDAAPKLAEGAAAVQLLGLKQRLPLSTRAARVLLTPVGAPFGGLILDAGRDAGLTEDQGVLAPEGVVGRIWSVGATQSEVLPADAPNASIAVMLARSRATGVLQGLGSNQAAIRYLNNQEVVQAGEAVYTSGLDQVFPRGLLVGYVTEVKPGDLELQVKVALAAPLRRLPLALILPAQPPLEVQPPLVPKRNPGEAR